MADETTESSEEMKLIELPVTYNDMSDVPLYGCDHIIALLTPDGSFTLQMFSTTPPVINDKDGSALTPPYRKCVGQFHITPATAQRLIDTLRQQSAHLPGKLS